MRGFFGGLHHELPSAGVDGEHLDIEERGGFDGFGDGIGNVVEFEVEEDVGTGSPDLFDDLGATADEEFLADFEGTDLT